MGRTGVKSVDKHPELPRTAMGRGAVRLVNPGSRGPRGLSPASFSVLDTKWTVSRAACTA